MNATTLTRTANMILGLVAPVTSRIVQARVEISDKAETAATDGVRVWLPTEFCQVKLAKDTQLAVGLLTHEIGHFLQPLKDLTEVEKATHCPHWLGNIAYDVQLESMMAALFPPLAKALVRVRKTVNGHMLAKYMQGLKQADLRENAELLALIGRYAQPTVSFDNGTHRNGVTLQTALDTFKDPQRRRRAAEYVAYLRSARTTRPNELCQYIRTFMRDFPELRDLPQQGGGGGAGSDAADGQPQPGGGGQLEPGYGTIEVTGKAAGVLQDEAQEAVRGNRPPGEDAIPELTEYQVQRPLIQPEAARFARQLRPHFTMRRGGLQIVAPGTLDRRAVARGEILPMRMEIPGKEVARPQLVIYLDRSYSMYQYGSYRPACLAAQAVALAVKEAGGDVVGVLFDDKAVITRTANDQVLFEDPNLLHYGSDTLFTYLTEVWRRWPDHHVLVITDGCGRAPDVVFPADKARTSVILIPPEDDDTSPRTFAAKVVVLRDLAGLANVLALLSPRSWLSS